MATNSLGHTFAVAITYGNGSDNKPVKTVDTTQAVKKPISQVRFGKHLPDDAVKLAYTAVDEISTETNITIIDHSTSVPQNSPELITGEEIFSGISYNSFYSNILISDVFSVATPTQPSTPLYYEHALLGTIDSTTVIILDSSFQPVGSHLYRVVEISVYDEVTGIPASPAEVDHIAIYNNLENIYDDTTAVYNENTGKLEVSGTLEVYYVRYIDPSDDSIQTVLLNNKPIYKPATTSDIWYISMKLKTWVKAYLVEELGTYYKITLPTATTYGITYLSETRIYIKEFLADDKNLPWFLRITNGSFVYNDSVSGYRYVYEIPEFRSQLFNPIQPYKIVTGETIEKIGSGLVRLQHVPMALDDFPIEIIIKDANETVLYALTTDSTRHGNAYEYSTTVFWDSTKITSWDNNSGLVLIDIKLKDYWVMTSIYYYKEETYEYISLDLNPISNTSTAVGGFFAIYLVPRATVNDTADAEVTIYHIQVDRDGTIINCSQDSLNKTVAAGGILGMTYGERNNILVNTFLDTYTLETVDGDSPGQESRYLILGEVSIKQHTAPYRVTILDVRERGGGVREEYVREAKQIVPEVTWYSDLCSLDGLSYPGRASVVVKLPYTILDTYGGRFTEQDVHEIVKRHMAFGHYPLIRYYGVIPNVSIREDSLDYDGSVLLEWSSETADYTFNIYYGLLPDGKFTKHNTVAIPNSAILNMYHVDGLSPNVAYWIYVTAIDANGVEGPRSRAIEIIPMEDGNTISRTGHTFSCPITLESSFGHEFTVTIT